MAKTVIEILRARLAALDAEAQRVRQALELLSDVVAEPPRRKRRSKKLRAGSFLQAVYLAVTPGLEVTTHAVVQRLGEEQAKGRTVTLQSVSAALGVLVKKRLLVARRPEGSKSFLWARPA